MGASGRAGQGELNPGSSSELFEGGGAGFSDHQVPTPPWVSLWTEVEYGGDHSSLVNSGRNLGAVLRFISRDNFLPHPFAEFNSPSLYLFHI